MKNSTVLGKTKSQTAIIDTLLLAFILKDYFKTWVFDALAITPIEKDNALFL